MTKEITPEELLEINSINNKYLTLHQALGVNTVSLEVNKEQCIELTNEKETLYKNYKELEERHSIIGKTLTDKYGEGTLDLVTGVLTLA